MSKDKKRFYKFLIPSLLGLFLFIIPFPYKDSFNLGMAIISDFLETIFEPYIGIIIITVICISAIISFLCESC
jgi:nucleoside recognition membrane protein YjiH